MLQSHRKGATETEDFTLIISDANFKVGQRKEQSRIKAFGKILLEQRREWAQKEPITLHLRDIYLYKCQVLLRFKTQWLPSVLSSLSFMFNSAPCSEMSTISALVLPLANSA